MTRLMRLGPPIDARAMFAPERAALLTLLSGLSGTDLSRPTSCPDWSVSDIATHLLGDDLSRLSRSRDQHEGLDFRHGEDLPTFLNRINEEWVVAARRLSPALLVGMLQWTGSQVEQFWQVQDPHRIGEPVTWAGPEPAPVWLDMARDFTEYWLHRQQILLALGRPDDSRPEARHLVFDTLIRALPHTLRTQDAPAGTTVTVTVTGPGGGRWTARALVDGWALSAGSAPTPAAQVTLDGHTAWQVWTGGIDPQAAHDRIIIEGDQRLGAAGLDMVSIIRRG